MKRIICIFIAALLLLQCAIGVAAAEDTARTIVLSSTETDGTYAHTATLDGTAVPEYDYVWHIDPTTDHGQVKNSPGEYYTGTAPSCQDPVYIAHDIIYYPMLDQNKFQQVRYDGENEWVYFYEAAGYENYIFSTLPVQRTGFPSHMMHTAEEAWQNAVLYITQPGTYRLRGTWHGQVRIDLGDENDVFADPDKKVTLILDGVDITCTVAPGVVFASVFECDNTWEDQDTHSHITDTAEAGAHVIIADGTVNYVRGVNIYRLLRTKYKDDDSTDTYPAQKKQYKLDAAFYSYQSMRIDGQQDGTGILNIISGHEGLDSELHLTINGGNINIYSQDDGINVNEDDVSVVTVNGGNLHICAGLGAEGDGIDSNGYLVINGGTVISTANPAADSGLDSDRGSFVNGGTVVALGATMDWAEADSTAGNAQPVLNLRFAGSQSADEAIVITDAQQQVVFAYDPDKDEVTGDYDRTYSGAIVSAPGLSVGNTYHIYIGADVNGTEISGVYDCAGTVRFTGATLQCYSGNHIDGFGGQRSEGFGGQRPEGFDGQQPPEGFGGQRPEGFGGQQPPEGFGGQFQGSFRPGQSEDLQGASCAYETGFTLQTQVNAFSSVTDYRHVPQAQADGTYLCSSCGNTYADAACTQLIETVPQSADPLLIVLLSLGGCALIGAIGAFIWLRKRKKQG